MTGSFPYDLKEVLFPLPPPIPCFAISERSTNRARSCSPPFCDTSRRFRFLRKTRSMTARVVAFLLRPEENRGLEEFLFLRQNAPFLSFGAAEPFAEPISRFLQISFCAEL